MLGKVSISSNKVKNKTIQKDKKSISSSDANIDKHQGMSRASKKRRKKLTKSDTIIEKKQKHDDIVNENVYKDEDDNDEDDDDEDDDEDKHNEISRKLKKREFHNESYKFDETVDVEITTKSIIDLLELEDVKGNSYLI